MIMRSIFFIILSSLLVSTNPNFSKDIKPQTNKISKVSAPILSPTESLYRFMNLDSILNFEALDKAMQGFNSVKTANKDILTIIDFSLPSTEKRMYVLDMKNKKLLFHTIVSHGRNSGEKYATSFSNRHGSFQSSLGFYETKNTYQGGNGYSLVLDGLEKGINDQAKARAVVIHGADYASQAVINSTGRLGRSYGCPALPRELNRPIIDTIKNGSLLFIYADNKEYLANSKIIKPLKERTLLAGSSLPSAVKEQRIL